MSANRIPISSLGDIVAFCDPAGGKTEVKRARARSAIVVLAQDFYQRIFLLYAWAARCTTDKLVDKLFWVNDEFHPRVFGVEANAMQVLFVNVVNRESRLRMERLRVRPVWQPTKVEKRYYNRTTIQPVINEGRLFMQDTQVEARAELATHPTNPICDIPDAIRSAIVLLPKRVEKVQRSEECERHLARLHAVGASQDEIAAYLSRYAAAQTTVDDTQLYEELSNAARSPYGYSR